MREFRAKTTKKENGEHAFNNVWVEGDLVVSRGKYYIHPRANAFQVDNELAKLVVMHEVIPETIGQFTGLTDKNGKKIFEGDIVKENDIYHKGELQIKGNTWRVVFADGLFFGNFKDISVYLQSLDGMEVIGNIHDNEELLDKGE